jgi:glutathione S-transferase
MIDLYAAGTSNGMRARIALEECGLSYNFHPINLDQGENRTPQFLAMNPVGQIPVIVDSEGPGGKPVTLSQSSAILMYCAEKSGKHLPKAADRPAFLEALMRASTDITPTLGAIFNSGVERRAGQAQIRRGRRFHHRRHLALRRLRAHVEGDPRAGRGLSEPGALGAGDRRPAGDAARPEVLGR